MPGWELIPTAGGGDCLFHACAAALTEAASLATKAETINGPEAGNKIHVTAAHLRHLVARSIMTPTPTVLSTLATWMQLIEAGLHEDAPQAASVYQRYLAQGKKLTRADLCCVAQAMLDPGIYWGDEYAIDVIQRTFNCAILVYNRNMVRQGHRDIPDSVNFYIPMLYNNDHYDLLRYMGRSILYTIPQD